MGKVLAGFIWLGPGTSGRWQAYVNVETHVRLS